MRIIYDVKDHDIFALMQELSQQNPDTSVNRLYYPATWPLHVLHHSVFEFFSQIGQKEPTVVRALSQITGLEYY